MTKTLSDLGNEFIEKLRAHDAEMQFPGAADALRRVLGFTPEYPVKLDKHSNMYGEGDETAPFFSKAMLYNLIGKEDARTLRALLHRLCETLGVEQYPW